MKRLKVGSLVILSLVLALQITVGVSEAKTAPQVIVATGHTVSQQVLGEPKVTILPDGYTRIQQVEQFVYASDNLEYAKYLSGVNTIKVVMLLDPSGLPVSIKGTFHNVISGNDKAGWNGTFEGMLLPTGVQINATGRGWGDLAAFKDEVIQNPDNTFTAKIYPPRSQS